MNTHMLTAALLAVLAMPAMAQDQKPGPGPVVKVQLTLARYQGEKKISSLPYMMTVNTEDRSRSGRATLRLGTQVPITTLSRQGTDANAPSVPTVIYKDIGTNIDCLVYAYEDGRFRLDLTVEDSSIEGAPESGKAIPSTPAIPSNPPFRSFRTSNQLLLRDGQSTQYTTATDKVSGEVWKVDVTLNVLK